MLATANIDTFVSDAEYARLRADDDVFTWWVRPGMYAGTYSMLEHKQGGAVLVDVHNDCVFSGPYNDEHWRDNLFAVMSLMHECTFIVPIRDFVKLEAYLAHGAEPPNTGAVNIRVLEQARYIASARLGETVSAPHWAAWFTWPPENVRFVRVTEERQ